MHVFVVDTDRNPLTPCCAAVARKLLKQGKAAIFRRFPFAIILKEAKLEAVPHKLRIKIDPGSKTTGLALLQESDVGDTVVWAAELNHRGYAIKKNLDRRRALRRGRRSRTTRYRVCRFNNRSRPKGWIPPSLLSRVENTITWVNRICRLGPIGGLSMELVRFDTQLMQSPEISGIEYQQGELQGYEVREYLLEKFARKCVYCGEKDVPLQIEHVVPRHPAHGPMGTNRVSNLALACDVCNKAKGNRQPDEWLAKLQKSTVEKDKLRAGNLPKVLKKLKQPLKDAAAVNSTRWALFRALERIGLPMEVGSGGLTKFNRTRRNLPKTHWLDAACVGKSTPNRILVPNGPILAITATGHGKRQRCVTDKYGFPIKHAPKAKSFMGFQTGDIVKAAIPKGKYEGTHSGRIAIRFRPSFKLNGFDVNPKYLRISQKADGYAYEFALGAQLSSTQMNQCPPPALNW